MTTCMTSEDASFLSPRHTLYPDFTPPYLTIIHKVRFLITWEAVKNKGRYVLSSTYPHLLSADGASCKTRYLISGGLSHAPSVTSMVCSRCVSVSPFALCCTRSYTPMGKCMRVDDKRAHGGYIGPPSLHVLDYDTCLHLGRVRAHTHLTKQSTWAPPLHFFWLLCCNGLRRHTRRATALNRTRRSTGGQRHHIYVPWWSGGGSTLPWRKYSIPTT
ncbi:hypothetical protein V8E53_013259 [Lactarius tabidus]